jgi:hypothetical protein
MHACILYEYSPAGGAWRDGTECDASGIHCSLVFRWVIHCRLFKSAEFVALLIASFHGCNWNQARVGRRGIQCRLCDCPHASTRVSSRKFYCLNAVTAQSEWLKTQQRWQHNRCTLVWSIICQRWRFLLPREPCHCAPNRIQVQHALNCLSELF